MVFNGNVNVTIFFCSSKKKVAKRKRRPDGMRNSLYLFVAELIPTFVGSRQRD